MNLVLQKKMQYSLENSLNRFYIWFDLNYQTSEGLRDKAEEALRMWKRFDVKLCNSKKSLFAEYVQQLTKKLSEFQSYAWFITENNKRGSDTGEDSEMDMNMRWQLDRNNCPIRLWLEQKKWENAHSWYKEDGWDYFFLYILHNSDLFCFIAYSWCMKNSTTGEPENTLFFI